jgi:hypothetical protein
VTAVVGLASPSAPVVVTRAGAEAAGGALDGGVELHARSAALARRGNETRIVKVFMAIPE